MPLKVIRRPYQDCAYRWALSTSGISTGEGDCSESQCLVLNGDFELDFSACASKGDKLVWSGECEVGNGGSSPCGDYSIEVAGVSGFDCASTYNGTFLMRSRLEDVFDDHGCVWSSQHNGPIVECADISCDCIDHPDGVPWEFYQTAGVPRMLAMNLGLCTAAGSYLDSKPAIYSRPGGRLPDPPPATITFTLDTVNCGTGWPATITATLLSGDDKTGPETNDRIRSKWHLDYDINAQLWTLRSFNRIDYPVYTLSDASPCDGETKTLTLADKGSSADGCGVAPAEMTITRVCPPDRVGKSALLEDRKPNGATGKRKRQCGCDCLDEVDDRRQCATKCGGGTTGGCDECTCASEITWTVTLPDVIVPGHGLEPIPAGTYELTHDYFCTWKHIGHDSGNQFTLHFTISGGVPSFLIQASDSGLCCYSVATIVGDGPVSCDGSAIVVDSASQTHVDSTGVPSTLTLSPSSSCPDTSGSGPYNTAEGCENYPDEPGTACLYPEAINCCANTAGKDVPCAYTVEFECDLFFDIEDVRHKIAAKQVTLRRECYFEDPCLFVAPGPESSTGGSPVMDTDGFPGAQPVCSSCADLCLTGCTWSAYTVAACPPASGCDCGLALCYGTTPLTAHVGTIAGLTQTTIQLDQALPLDVIPACRTYVSFIGGIENRDVFGLNYAMFADLQLSERCLSLSLQYFDNSVSATTFEYATYTASVPDPIVCPDSIVFTKTSGGSVFPNTVEITNP